MILIDFSDFALVFGFTDEFKLPTAIEEDQINVTLMRSMHSDHQKEITDSDLMMVCCVNVFIYQVKSNYSYDELHTRSVKRHEVT